MDRELLALLRILQIAYQAGITIERIKFCNGMTVDLEEHKKEEIPQPQAEALMASDQDKTATEAQLENFKPALQKMILDEVEKFFYRVFPESRPAN